MRSRFKIWQEVLSSLKQRVKAGLHHPGVLYLCLSSSSLLLGIMLLFLSLRHLVFDTWQSLDLASSALDFVNSWSRWLYTVGRSAEKIYGDVCSKTKKPKPKTQIWRITNVAIRVRQRERRFS